MAITGITAKEYEEFLNNGGSVTVQIARDDFSKDGEFETAPFLKDKLETGFELPPSVIIHDDKSAGQIYAIGSDWSKVTTHIYRNGGKIIYRKVGENKYEADLRLP